ncbi:unnamed protein product [Prunus armeniaca]
MRTNLKLQMGLKKRQMGLNKMGLINVQIVRGVILDRKIEKPQKPTDNLPQWNRNHGKPNHICGMKNRTAFVVAIALVLKQDNGVLQIHSPPPILEFVVNA